MELQSSTTESGGDTTDQGLLLAYSKKFDELTRWDTYGECIVGCGTGGAIYVLLYVAGSWWFGFWGFELLLLWPVLVFLGFLAGLISGGLVSLVVMPFNASLGWPLKSLWCSFIVGGLAAFIPFLFPLFMLRPDDSELLYLAAVGAIPAMALGHFCAYWNTKSVVQDHNSRFGVVQHDAAQPDVRKSRFSITHIMIATIWVAVGAALISAFSPQIQTQLAKFFFLSQFVAGVLAIFLIKIVSFVQAHRKRKGSAV